MNNSQGSNPDEGSQADRKSDELKEALSNLAARLETEENVEKLARILEKEWTDSESDSVTRDLSFTRFEEKRKASENQ